MAARLVNVFCTSSADLPTHIRRIGEDVEGNPLGCALVIHIDLPPDRALVDVHHDLDSGVDFFTAGFRP